MIAHRLSTIKHCDHIFEIKDGVISRQTHNLCVDIFLCQIFIIGDIILMLNNSSILDHRWHGFVCQNLYPNDTKTI